MSNIGAYRLMELLAARLRNSWSAAARVKVIIAESPAAGIELLSNARQATLVLFYVSDSPAGFEIPGLDTAVEASVRFGLAQQAGLSLAGIKPANVLQLADDLKSFLAGADAQFASLIGDGWLEYKGMSYIATEAGKLLNGYALTYAPRYAYECNH